MSNEFLTVFYFLIAGMILGITVVKKEYIALVIWSIVTIIAFYIQLHGGLFI